MTHLPRFGALLLAFAVPVGAAELQVVTLSPARHAIAPATSAVSVTFDRALQTASITAASLRVFGRTSGPAAGAISFSNADKTVTLTPTRAFAAGETVLVNLADSIVAADASPLRAAGYAYAFVAQAQPAAMVFEPIDVMSNRTNPGTGTRIYGAMAADLDDDGFVDLTTVNEDSADLRVFMNRADGSGLFDPFLTPPRTIGFESSPNEPGDFDNDGRIDIAVSSSGDGRVDIVLGNGNGTFDAPQSIPTGNEPHGIAVLDVDGDADLDVANSVRSGDVVALTLNNGSGVFAAATSFDSGGDGEYGLAAADMNNDGISDLIVGAQDSEDIVVLLGTGAGTFNPGLVQSAGGQVWQLVTGDVNGDGNMDVTTSNAFSNTGSILIGNGNGTLDPPVTYAAPGHVVATDLGDLDGDGDLDWVLSGFTGAAWRLFTNDGSGVFTATQNFPASSNPSCAVLTDLDNDGDLDMALTDEIADEVQLLRNGVVSPCPPAPQLCRAPIDSGKGLLKMKDKTPDSGDQILWKWGKGSATTLAELGAPQASDDYALCIYDGGALVASALAPAEDTSCGGPCWSGDANGFAYKDGDLTPSGVRQLKLRAGVGGSARMLVKGKGALLQMPDLGSLDGPIEAQLIKSSGGPCWGATFSLPFLQADGVTFKDKSD